MKDILIITGSVGGRERKGPLRHNNNCNYDNCDYLAIDDEHKQFQKSGWKNTNSYIPFSSIDKYKERRNCKLYKILNTILYPNYKYIVWHDANVSLIGDPNEIIKQHADADIVVGPHRKRRCLYDEINLVNKVKLDTSETLKQQKAYYKLQGVPRKYGLWHCNAMIMKNTTAVKKFQLMWWEQICKFSSRDQISFAYCAYKMKNEIQIATSKLKYRLVSRSWGRA